MGFLIKHKINPHVLVRDLQNILGYDILFYLGAKAGNPGGSYNTFQ